LIDRLRIAFFPAAELARLEALAEAAYLAMYDAPRHSVPDLHDDAQGYLSQAIALAKRMRRTDDAARLEQRKRHIYDVYDHQFR
jgi:hypothetical protein